jgi:hypothetical protein
LYVRHLLTASGSEAPEPGRAALLLDLVRRCLEASPRLCRIYTCARDPVAAAPTLKPLGFNTLDVPAARIDGAAYHSYVLALGPGSAHEWLIELAGRDLGSHIVSPSTRADAALERNL